MRGLLRDAISNCPSLFQFVLLRNATTFNEIKEACASYSEGQKLLYKNDDPTPSGVTFGESPRVVYQSEIEQKVDKLCDQMAELALALSQKKDQPSRPKICSYCKEEGHIATRARETHEGDEVWLCKRLRPQRGRLLLQAAEGP